MKKEARITFNIDDIIKVMGQIADIKLGAHTTHYEGEGIDKEKAKLTFCVSEDLGKLSSQPISDETLRKLSLDL